MQGGAEMIDPFLSILFVINTVFAFCNTKPVFKGISTSAAILCLAAIIEAM